MPGIAVELNRMDERSARMARRFEVPVLIAAVLVIPVIVIEESNVAEPWDTAAYVANWLIWTVFLAELVAMLVIVPDRRRWLVQHPLAPIVHETAAAPLVGAAELSA